MRKVKILSLITASIAGLTSMTLHAQTQEQPTQRPRMLHDGGSHDGHGPIADRHMSEMPLGAMHQITPEQLQRMVGHWMEKIKASPEQTRQVTQLALDAQKELKPLREKMRDLHEKQSNALLGQTVDRNALESLRKEGLQLHEQISSRMNRFMADAAQALTPEQRAQVSQMMHERRARMEQWRDKRSAHEGKASTGPMSSSAK